MWFQLHPPSHGLLNRSYAELASVITSATPITTKKDTIWCMNSWSKWRKQRNKTTNVSISENIWELDTHDLQLNLKCFVLEVWKKDSSENPLNSLHHIHVHVACGVIWYLRQDGGKRHWTYFKVLPSLILIYYRCRDEAPIASWCRIWEAPSKADIHNRRRANYGNLFFLVTIAHNHSWTQCSIWTV